MKRLQRCCFWVSLRLCILLVVFSSVFPCLAVKASETDVHEILGISFEELQEMLDENGVATLYFPSTFATGNYTVEETISLSTSGVQVDWVHYPYVNYATYGSEVIAFGATKLVTNTAESITLTLYNNGSLLFTQSGIAYFNVLSYTTKLSMIVTHQNGTVVTYPLTPVYDTNTSSIEVELDNSLADIVKIQFLYNGPITQTTGDKALIGGILKYGYILNTETVEEENHSKNIFELLQEFVGNFWTNMKSSITNAFAFLVDYINNFWTNLTEKVSGVFQPLFDYISSFWDNITSKFDYLVEQVVNIFVPDDDYFKTWLEDQYDFFIDRFGAFGYMYDYIVDLFTAFYNAEFGEPVLTFPSLELNIPNYGSYVISEEIEINLNELTEGIPYAVEMLKFATSAVMALSLSSYSMKLGEKILKR